MIPFVKINKVTGVYCAIHRDTLRCYVGSSLDIGRRRKQHLLDARNGSMSCFHRALREYGPDAFDFEVICECSKTELLEKENTFIKVLRAASFAGFNTMSEARANYLERSEATKQRISNSKTGKSFSDSHRASISRALKGKKQASKAIAARAASCGKPVLQIDASTDRVIAEFPSVKMAAQQLGISSARRITEVIKGRASKTYGFKFRLKND